MEPEALRPFDQACGLASHVVDDPAVARRWDEPSALHGLTVGGVAAHLYTAIRRLEVALDEDVAADPDVLHLHQFYGLNRIDEPGDLDAGWHPLIREDATRRAAYGPDAVAQRFRSLVTRLTARLADEPTERLVPVWTVPGAATTLRDYVRTRVVELVVHADDLAASVQLPPLAVPADAATTAIDALVGMARARSGDLHVIRGFTRAERTTAGTLRVL